MKTCQACGRSNRDHFKYCVGCGATLKDGRDEWRAVWKRWARNKRVLYFGLPMLAAICLVLLVLALALVESSSPRTERFQVSSAGSDIETMSHVRVQIPHDSVEGSAELVVKWPEGQVAATDSSQVLAPCSRIVDLDMSGKSLKKPAAVSLPYDPSKLPREASEEDLFAAYLDENNVWVPVPTTIDEKGNLATFSTDHFSEWAVFAVDVDRWIEQGKEVWGTFVENASLFLEKQLITSPIECEAPLDAAVAVSTDGKIVGGCAHPGTSGDFVAEIGNQKYIHVEAAPLDTTASTLKSGTIRGCTGSQWQVLPPGESASWTVHPGSQTSWVFEGKATGCTLAADIVLTLAEVVSSKLVPVKELSPLVLKLVPLVTRAASFEDFALALRSGDLFAATNAMYEVISDNDVREEFTKVLLAYLQKNAKAGAIKISPKMIEAVFKGIAWLDVAKTSASFLSAYVETGGTLSSRVTFARAPAVRVTNRQNCDAIRGKEYLSAEERDWFLRVCVTPVPTATTVSSSGAAWFRGIANVNSQPAPGATVEAFVGSTRCASVRADANAGYALRVPSAAEVAGCGSEGARVAFKVNGLMADQIGTWRVGTQILNLDISALSPVIAPGRT